MTTLILVRHGQSVANLNGIYVGHKKAELSELGHIQAEKMTEYVLKNFNVDKVYTSDLSRAKDTVKPIAKALGICEIPNKNLREIYAGDWEGKKFADLCELYPLEYGIWRTDIGNSKSNGGESVREMSQRVLLEITKIAEENDGKTVVIGTHATPIRAMQCLWQGKTFDEMKDVPWATNASITVAEYENGRFTLKVISEESYLEDLKSALPKNV